MLKWLAPFRPLYIQVLVAIAIAIVVGLVWPETGRAMKPMGDAFIAILKTLIGPIIFTTVVLGLTQIHDLGKLGRVATKALIYFEVVSTLALAVGLIVGNVFQPGAGLHATGPATGAAATAISNFEKSAAKAGGIVDFLMALIPKTFVSAFAEGEILQTLLLAILFGVAATTLAKRPSRTLDVIAEIQKLFFRMLGFVMHLAPFGAFGAMAYTVGTHGGSTLLSLMKLVLLVYGSCLFFIFVVLAGIAAMAGLSIFKILRLIKEEILLVLGTSSSEVALPRLLLQLQHRWHGNLYVDGGRLYFASHRHAAVAVAAIEHSCDPAVHLQGRRGGVGRGFRQTDGHLAIGSDTAPQWPWCPAWCRPLHVGGALHHQYDRQYGCHARHRQMGECVRSCQIRRLFGRSDFS